MSLIVKAECALIRVGNQFVTVLKHGLVPAGADEAHVQLLVDRKMVAEGDPVAGVAPVTRPAPFTVPKDDAKDDPKPGKP
jgi:hypothetical protein